MTIREYTIQDIEPMVAAQYRFMTYLSNIDDLGRLVCNPGYGEAYTTDLLEKLKEQDGQIYVAENDGKMVGFIAGVVEKESEIEKLSHIPLKQGRVLDLFVEEEYRGSGVGKQLMARVEEYFRDKKCDTALIEVFGPNKKAKNFYEQLGYADRDYDLQKSLK